MAYEGTQAGTDFGTTFPPMQARYVRLNILDSTRPPTIWEFQVFKPQISDRSPGKVRGSSRFIFV